MSKFKLIGLVASIAVLVACQQTTQQTASPQKDPNPSSGVFGQATTSQNAVAASQLPGLFADKDTINVTITGDIAASCKHSGCWMDLDMGNSEALHVTFKDESFTIPLDAAGKHAFAQGIAVREQIPVETLKNFARDEGKSDAEVALITEPAWAYEMIADGVLIEE